MSFKIGPFSIGRNSTDPTLAPDATADIEETGPPDMPPNLAREASATGALRTTEAATPETNESWGKQSATEQALQDATAGGFGVSLPPLLDI